MPTPVDEKCYHSDNGCPNGLSSTGPTDFKLSGDVELESKPTWAD
ncbi:MAG: hypothetical protein OQK82_09140 [Candidatus Pacearchaeota archaeon]|nr:hypothetical protein [Candidatus Pacearchaeota archaeon]